MAEMSVMEQRVLLAARIADEVSNLITDPGEELGMFERLCQETLSALPADMAWRAAMIALSPESAFNPVRWGQRPEWLLLPPDLQTEWRAWPAAFGRLLARNPRLKLAELLSEISETHTSSSWPDGWEDQIEDWVLAGTADTPPFDNRSDIDLTALHARLRVLHAVVGGWVWWANDAKRVVYGDAAAWAAQRDLYAETRRQVEDMRMLQAIERLKHLPAPAPGNSPAKDAEKSTKIFHPMSQFRLTPKR